MGEWKPGDVAAGTIDAYTGRFVYQGESNGWDELDGTECGWDGDYIKGLRPLVVIDPEDREQVGRIIDDYDIRRGVRPEADRARSPRIDQFQAALRSLIAPPKPEEPQSLGAVVNDAEGVCWVRWNVGDAPAPWRRQENKEDGSAIHVDYSRIAAVKVLSEGVTP